MDVDVPLFLPLSGQRRLSDLRRTAQQELSAGYSIEGQMNFESGWEFGYYLSNVITARASYNPKLEIADDWAAYRSLLRPVLTVFGDRAEAVEEAVVALARVQAEVLIYGRVRGQDPVDLSKLSGHAYMSGADTWVDLPRMLGLSLTQPDKIHMDETDDPQWNDMTALLAELDRVFAKSYSQFEALLGDDARSMMGEVGISF